MSNSNHPLPANVPFAAPALALIPAASPSPWRGQLRLLAAAVALVSVTGCAGIQRRAVSRRPTVILAHEPGACRPAALVDIDNPGRCRVQLVARGLDREYLAASAWIPAGQHHASFDLPDRFSWIVLEVDPLCESSIGRIRYRPSASICAPTPTTVASGWESSRF